MSDKTELREDFNQLMAQLDSEALYKIGFVKGINEVKVNAGMAQKACGVKTSAMVSCFEFPQCFDEENVQFQLGYNEALEKGKQSLFDILEKHELIQKTTE